MSWYMHFQWKRSLTISVITLHPSCVSIVCVLQHPDLIEKRRKAFADVIRQHLQTESSPMSEGVERDEGESHTPMSQDS